METPSTRYHERLTQDNAAVLLVDHQIGLFTGVRDTDVAQLKHNVVRFAKAAKDLGLPINATTTSRDSLWGRRFQSWPRCSQGSTFSTAPQ